MSTPRREENTLSPWTAWAESEQALFSYCKDFTKLYAQTLEQSLRLMGPYASGLASNKGAPVDGLSIAFKAVEQYQEQLFSQLESMLSLQSEIWESALAQRNIEALAQTRQSNKAAKNSTTTS